MADGGVGEIDSVSVAKSRPGEYERLRHPWNYNEYTGPIMIE